MKSSNNELVMNATGAVLKMKPSTDIQAIRNERKLKLAATFRLFGKYGFDEGVAGHVSVRDPKFQDHFWVNPLGKAFSKIKVSDLLLVNHNGDVVEGEGMLNGAAFTIHSHIHKARKDVVAAAHTHSFYGKTFSTLGKTLAPITQDACAFYQDHALFDVFDGVVLGEEEGLSIVSALGRKKALILQNHGLLTVGRSIDSAAWWYIAMERACQSQLLAESVGKPIEINNQVAKSTYDKIGRERTGWYSFSPLFSEILEEQPELSN